MRWLLILCVGLACVALSAVNAQTTKPAAATGPSTRSSIEILEALPKELQPTRRKAWGQEEARRANNWAAEHMSSPAVRTRGRIVTIVVSDANKALNPPQRIALDIENEINFGGQSWRESARFTTELTFDEGVKWRNIKPGAWVEIVASKSNVLLIAPEHEGSAHQIAFNADELKPTAEVTIRILRGPRDK